MPHSQKVYHAAGKGEDARVLGERIGEGRGEGLAALFGAPLAALACAAIGVADAEIPA